MPRKPNSIFYIYKITCKVTEKYYIGMHATSNINDGYMGSGRKLKYSINKYGLENHTKEILEFLPNLEQLKDRERQLVNEELLTDRLCMNLVNGGAGGFISPEGCKKGAVAGGFARSKKLKEDPEFRKEVKDRNSDIFKRLHKEGKIKPCDWTGRTHSPETKAKMSESAKHRRKKDIGIFSREETNE